MRQIAEQFAKGGAMNDFKRIDCTKYLDIYEYTCRCIEKEDSLIHHRMSWALQVNATVIAFIFVNDAFLNNVPGRESLFIVFGSIFGIFFTIISFLAIRSAVAQLDYLTESLNHVSDKLEDGPYEVVVTSPKMRRITNRVQTNSGLPRPFGADGSFDFARFAPQAYCIAIISAWLFALIRSI
jgi:hypothetical protein